jgi:hypothetical protein
LPAAHPLQHRLREAPDFQHAAALADALLNPQDRAYSVPQLFAFLDDASLSFGRWLSQAAYSPHCGVMEGLPQAPSIQELAPAEQVRRGRAVPRHDGDAQRVAYRSDRPGGSPQPDFAGDAWRGHVPHPPARHGVHTGTGANASRRAAAVLINRNHTHKDLVLPIDAAQKHLLDAVDGKRSIGESVAANPHASHAPLPANVARDFFERVWWWGQVVFDTSRQPAG